MAGNLKPLIEMFLRKCNYAPQNSYIFDRQSTNVRILINVEVELRRKALLDQNEWARKAENPGF
ncbi:hypothetical protein DEA98_21935 [Brucella pseudogrignonensis]|nr:hypothetical protein [Brucella pseudogrignonensis]